MAGKVRYPDLNVRRATILGTLATAAVYMLSLIAVFGIVPNSELQTSSEPFSTAASSNGASAFTTLVLMTGISAAIPYLFSAAAQLKWRLIDRKKGEAPQFLRDVIVAVLCIVFSILFIGYSRSTGAEASRSIGQVFGHECGPWAEWMPFVLAGVALLLGIPVYKRQVSCMAAPDPVPPYR